MRTGRGVAQVAAVILMILVALSASIVLWSMLSKFESGCKSSSKPFYDYVELEAARIVGGGGGEVYLWVRNYSGKPVVLGGMYVRSLDGKLVFYHDFLRNKYYSLHVYMPSTVGYSDVEFVNTSYFPSSTRVVDVSWDFMLINYSRIPPSNFLLSTHFYALRVNFNTTASTGDYVAIFFDPRTGMLGALTSSESVESVRVKLGEWYTLEVKLSSTPTETHCYVYIDKDLIYNTTFTGQLEPQTGVSFILNAEYFTYGPSVYYNFCIDDVMVNGKVVEDFNDKTDSFFTTKTINSAYYDFIKTTPKEYIINPGEVLEIKLSPIYHVRKGEDYIIELTTTNGFKTTYTVRVE